MYHSHELYHMEYEERLRKFLEEQRMEKFLPARKNWFAQALNQIRMFLW